MGGEKRALKDLLESLKESLGIYLVSQLVQAPLDTALGTAWLTLQEDKMFAVALCPRSKYLGNLKEIGQGEIGDGASSLRASVKLGATLWKHGGPR